MKTRESGMPEELQWESFFAPAQVLRLLGLDESCMNVLDIGCGYGTFTIPAAQMVQGTVYAVDIEPEMVRRVGARAQAAAAQNVVAYQRDFLTEGTGRPEASVDYVMAFNMLHAEDPDTILREAWRVLRPGGRLGIMHWRCDVATPRGPSLFIRPHPGQCRAWAEAIGFIAAGTSPVALPPYHYGWRLWRPEHKEHA